MYCAPSFDAAPVAGFPIGQLRECDKLRIEVKAECGLVLEQNHDCLQVGIDFNALQDLAFDFRETKEAACAPCAFLAGMCTLMVSHRSPFFGR